MDHSLQKSSVWYARLRYTVSYCWWDFWLGGQFSLTETRGDLERFISMQREERLDIYCLSDPLTL